jgi:hypothetical protein
VHGVFVVFWGDNLLIGIVVQRYAKNVKNCPNSVIILGSFWVSWFGVVGLF